MAAGALLFGRGVAETVGKSIIPLDLQSALSVQISAAFGLHLFSMLGIPVSTSQKEATKFVITAKSLTGVFYAPEAVALQLPMEQSGLDLTTKRVINSAHKHNMAVHYWTIDNKEDMRMLIENGADGLITDRPDIMLELLEEMGF